MELINLYKVFAIIEDEKYCIVKYKDFKEIVPGNDIDIFTFDVNRTARKLINAIEQQIIGNIELKIHVSSSENLKCFIDVLNHGKIYIRLDLCGELPEYTRVMVKPGLFDCSVEKAKCLQVSDGGDICNLKVIAEEQDLIIRYLEYIEWYERRPDKIKHLNYILNQVQSEEERRVLLDDLHYYTNFPYVKYDVKKGKTGPIESFRFIFEKCKGKSLGDLLAIFRQKFL